HYGVRRRRRNHSARSSHPPKLLGEGWLCGSPRGTRPGCGAQRRGNSKVPGSVKECEHCIPSREFVPPQHTKGWAYPLTPGPSPRWGEGKVSYLTPSPPSGERVPEGRVRGTHVQVKS